MLDLQHLPSGADVTKIVVTTASAQMVTTWHKRRGAQWVYVFGLGRAGNGGNGAGGGSNYAGGGGGGSGGQTVVLIPAMMIPDSLYITNATNGNTLVGFESTLASTQGLLLRANAGGNGGNATTTTAGSAGSAGAVATIATMPRAGGGFYTLLVGQAGTTGANDIAYPTTGLRVSGGAAGGACGAASAAGVAGRAVAYVQTPQLSAAYSNTGGAGGPSLGDPNGRPGNAGLSFAGYNLFAGGSGGGGTWGAASPVGGRGGDCVDAYGCGGGGGGGGFLTGGAGGNGGPGLVLIAQW